MSYFKGALLKKVTKNQRSSDPINGHLTPGPGIYFNACIHVYSPRSGADNPLGTNVDINRKLLSLCQFVASFKTIFLKLDFIHIFLMFFHMCIAPGRGRQHTGENFDDNRKAFPLCPYVASFKMISTKSDFIHILMILKHVYSPGPRAYNTWGQNFDVNRKPLSLCQFVSNLKKRNLV